MHPHELKHYVHPLTDQADDFDQLIASIGDASIVLLGEATHGTQEFYEARTQISKRLIQEKGFGSICIEGDWPYAYRVNRYINHQSDDTSAEQALGDFTGFPTWMWRNESTADLVTWLHRYNAEVDAKKAAHFYGLDLYSLYASITEIINTLEHIDTQAAADARERYACFDAYVDPQDYGHAATRDPARSCKKEALAQLLAFQQKQSSFFKDTLMHELEQKLFVELNAQVVKDAERYYRSLYEGDHATSWNIRDGHMLSAVDTIRSYKQRMHISDKVVIWAHNSHIGDARATQMSLHGELNIGQLAKQRYGDDAFSVGFTTYEGTVSAASSWDGPVERKTVRPALEGSIERILHETGVPKFVLPLQENPEIARFFAGNKLERAIGVIYRPETERQSHYFHARLSQQFDCVVHYDHSTAVTPLEQTAMWQQGEGVPETYPFGI